MNKIEFRTNADAELRSIERESFEQLHRGSANGNRIGILEDGVEFVPATIPPDEARFLQTQVFQPSEIARWFNIQPHELFETSPLKH